MAKQEEERRKKEEADLIKPIPTQKVPFGVDPKTMLCAFFKAGRCDKGTKCKFRFVGSPIKLLALVLIYGHTVTIWT